MTDRGPRAGVAPPIRRPFSFKIALGIASTVSIPPALPGLAVTHGDYHPWNALLRESDDAAFVIDWTQADVSDYRFDLGWTLVMMRTNFGRETRDAALSSYERASGHFVPDVEFLIHDGTRGVAHIGCFRRRPPGVCA